MRLTKASAWRRSSVSTSPTAPGWAAASAIWVDNNISERFGSREASRPASAALAASDAASVKVENGVVKFYFASGKADLAAGAGDALADVVKGAKAGDKIVVSWVDDKGDKRTDEATVA